MVENRDKIKIDKEKVSIVSWINGIYIFTNIQGYVYIIYVLRSIHIVIYKRIFIIIIVRYTLSLYSFLDGLQPFGILRLSPAFNVTSIVIFICFEPFPK